jgi:AraC-like DNA-binding protein
MFAIGFVVINNTLSYYHSRSQYLSQLQQRLDASSSAVGSQMMMVFRLGSTFFQEKNTIIYFKPESTQTTETQSEIWRVQELIKKDENAFDPLIHSIFCYYPSDDTVLTSAGRYDKDFYFSSIASYSGQSPQVWDTDFLVSGKRTVLPEIQLNTRSGKIAVIPVVTVSRLSGQLAIHVCNISLASVEQLLTIHGAIGSQLMIIDNLGRPIFDRTDSLAQDFLAHVEIPSSQILLTSFNEDTGWTFYEPVGKAWISQMMGKIYYPSVFLVLLLCAIGLLLVFFFSLRIYRPIDAMKMLLPPSKGKGRIDELSNLRSEVEGLILKEDQHHLQELDFQLDFARHSLNLLLHGIQPKELPRALSILNAQRGFIYSGYLCCAVLIEYFPAFYQEQEESTRETFRCGVLSLLRSLVKDQYPSLVLALEDDLYEYVFNLEKPDDTVQVIQLLQAQGLLFAEESRFYSLSFGVGAPVESIQNLAISYNQALAALQVREASRAFQVIDFARIPPKKKVAFSFYDQKGIANNLLTGNNEVLSKYLRSLIEKNEQRGIEEDNMTELYRQILLVGRRALEEHGHQVSEVDRFTLLYNELAITQSKQVLANLKGELCRLFVDIQNLVVVFEPASTQRSTIQEVKQYIKTHYHLPLSLEIVADAQGLSSKYLSRLFKEETKENLSEFIVKVRVEQAKRLLSQTNKKIGEISLAVGIESRATFLRIFQKAEGISPSDYRKLEEHKRHEGDRT